MSGHSKWSTIKHKKAVLDARRGKEWSKLARAVTMTAKSGGGNPSDNPRLRLAIDKAKAANMPKDTIEKAIKKGTGELAGESYEEVLYEGYGPVGVAIMCRATTDNRNRTAGEIRKLFERGGGNLGAQNCVAFQFSPKGIIVITGDQVDEDRLMELALELGAEDVSSNEPIHEVTCAPDRFETIRDALSSSGFTIQSADLTMVSSIPVPLELDAARKVMRLVDSLEEHDDVDEVYSNADLSEEVASILSRE